MCGRVMRFAACGAVLATVTGCVTLSTEINDTIPANPNATVNVAGTWRWGTFETIDEGTITLSQSRDTVTVDGVEYFLPPNLRDLTGQADLAGNVLDILMVAKNGTEYQADVVLTFSEDGQRFIADFSDTNGDVGGKVGSKIE